MKTIGIIGGMSWESTAVYYRLINEEVRRRLGGLHSARILLSSVDFAEVETMQREGDWERAGAFLAAEARRLEQAGAGLLLIATNTMHKVAGEVERAVEAPLLHIADATAEEIRNAGVRTAGLLGTRFTMEEAFYRGRLEDRFGIPVLVPEREEREEIHRVIYEELCVGRIREESRRRFRAAAESLRERGAGGVILGCTEIPLLLRPEDVSCPLFDTTAIHARRAAGEALAAV